MAGSDVQFTSNGGTAAGYLALPESGQGPGVVVIQEWWGLNDQIRRTADRFAAEGFVALAPDCYHGTEVPIGEPDEADKMMMALDIDRFGRDARGAARYLAQHPAVTSGRVGVIGFCMGGQLALLTGTLAPEEIGAVVDMYGIHPHVKPDYRRMRAPVLALFGGRDHSIDAATRQRLERQLREAGIAVEMDVYPEADHAFMNDERPEVYDAAATEDAWRRIIAFFREHLRPRP